MEDVEEIKEVEERRRRSRLGRGRSKMRTIRKRWRQICMRNWRNCRASGTWYSWK